jgi:hypothetical protein
MTPDGRMLPVERRDLEWAVWPGRKPTSIPQTVAIRKVELAPVKPPRLQLVTAPRTCSDCGRVLRVGDFPLCPHVPPR